MVDNVAISAGTGTTIAADDIGGGVLAQRVKIVVGVDGVGNDLAPGQTTKSASLPVTLASDQGALAVTLPVGQTTKSASVPVVWASDSLGVQTKSASISIAVASDQLGQGVKAASLPVTLASDQGALAVTVPVGQQAMAASTPVTIASNQSAVPVTVPVGQAAMAASTPVVIASNQSAIAVTVPVGQNVKASSQSVTIASDQGALSISAVSQAYDPAVTVTRPANVTAYTANDVLGGAIQFITSGPSASTVLINNVQLELDIASIPAGMTSFRLYLYNVTPPSALADNAAWDLPSGDRTSFLGYIDLGTPVDLGSTLYCESISVNKQLKLSGTDIFGYIVTNGGFTPAANSEVYKVTLHTVAV